MTCLDSRVYGRNDSSMSRNTNAIVEMTVLDSLFP